MMKCVARDVVGHVKSVMVSDKREDDDTIAVSSIDLECNARLIQHTVTTKSCHHSYLIHQSCHTKNCPQSFKASDLLHTLHKLMHSQCVKWMQ